VLSWSRGGRRALGSSAHESNFFARYRRDPSQGGLLVNKRDIPLTFGEMAKPPPPSALPPSRPPVLASTAPVTTRRPLPAAPRPVASTTATRPNPSAIPPSERRPLAAVARQLNLTEREFVALVGMAIELYVELDTVHELPDSPEFSEDRALRAEFVKEVLDTYLATPAHARISPVTLLRAMETSAPLGRVAGTTPYARGEDEALGRMEATLLLMEANRIKPRANGRPTAAAATARAMTTDEILRDLDRRLDRLMAGVQARGSSTGVRVSAAPRTSADLIRDIDERLDRIESRMRTRR
jgi:hypothetical protein